MLTGVSLLNELGRWLCVQLGRMSIELTILAGIVLIAMQVLRVKSPALRHLFWGLLLAKPVATFLVASPVSFYMVFWPPPPTIMDAPAPAIVQAEPASVPVSVALPPQTSEPLPVPSYPKTPPVWRQIDRYGFASAVWIAVALILGLRLILGCAYVALLRTTTLIQREGPLSLLLDEAGTALKMRRRVRIALTRVAHGPVLAGIFRPVILLPENMTDALTRGQLKLVVTHELAHARRWDNLVLLIQRFAEMLFFFHPVVWLCGWMMRREAEAACDDMVVAAYGDTESMSAAAYADSLTRVAEMKCGITRRLLVNTFAAAESNFHRRIHRILSGRHTRTTLWLSLATGAALILIGALGLPAASSPKDTNKSDVSQRIAQGDGKSDDGGCKEVDISGAGAHLREVLEERVTTDFDNVHLATALAQLNRDYGVNAAIDWRVIAPDELRENGWHCWYVRRRHDGGHLHNVHDKDMRLKNVLMGLAMLSIGNGTIEVGPNVVWVTRKEMADSDAKRLRPSVESASPAVREALAKAISVDFNNVHLDQVLPGFARDCAATFDVDYRFVPPVEQANLVKDETRYVTDGFLPAIRLTGIPAGEALDAILRTMNLTYHCEGDVIHIIPNGGMHPQAWWTEYEKNHAPTAREPDDKGKPTASSAGIRSATTEAHS